VTGVRGGIEAAVAVAGYLDLDWADLAGNFVRWQHDLDTAGWHPKTAGRRVD
jgi:hypothetical protein